MNIIKKITVLTLIIPITLFVVGCGKEKVEQDASTTSKTTVSEVVTPVKTTPSKSPAIPPLNTAPKTTPDDTVSNKAVPDKTATKTNPTKVTKCLPEQRKVDLCIEIYQPVCGTVNVQCIKAPCPPTKETFSSPCIACRNSLVSSYTDGACVK